MSVPRDWNAERLAEEALKLAAEYRKAPLAIEDGAFGLFVHLLAQVDAEMCQATLDAARKIVRNRSKEEL